jgi:predicted RNase H-like HicB family nuclease
MRQALQYFVDYWEGDKEQIPKEEERKTHMNHDLGNVNLDSSDTETSEEFIQPLKSTEPVSELSEELPPLPPTPTPSRSPSPDPPSLVTPAPAPIVPPLMLPVIEDSDVQNTYNIPPPPPPPPQFVNPTPLSPEVMDFIKMYNNDHACTNYFVVEDEQDDEFTDDSTGTYIESDIIIETTEEEPEMFIPEQGTILDYELEEPQHQDPQDNLEPDMVSYEEIMELIKDRPYYIENGQMYVWNDEEWESVLDLVVWDEEAQDWVEFTGSLEDFKDCLEEPNNDINSNTPYELLQESEHELEHDVEDDVEHEFPSDLTTPLLQDYEVQNEDLGFADNNNWQYNHEDMVWVENPVYGCEFDFEPQPEHESEAEPESESDIISDFSTDLSEDYEYVIVPEPSDSISDSDDISEALDELEQILDECLLETTDESYSLSNSNTSTFEDDDIVTFTEDYTDEISMESSDVIDYENIVTESESEEVSITEEDRILTELYNKWIVAEYETTEDKFEVSPSPSLGDLYVAYQRHTNNVAKISNYFYQYPLLSAIKLEILDVYEELIMKFIARTIVDCEYCLRDETPDVYVCDDNGSALYELPEFIMKYLTLMNQTESCDNVMNKLLKYHGVPYMAVLYVMNENGEYVEKYKMD